MIEQQSLLHGKSGSPIAPATVLLAIKGVIELCHQSQREQRNAALEYVLDELEVIQQAVIRSWPLPGKVKQQIDIGPFSAKNLEDWNEELADTLMKLDYALQHDGALIERLMLHDVSKARANASLRTA